MILSVLTIAGVFLGLASAASAADKLTATIETSKGNIELELTPDVRGKRIHIYVAVVAPDSSVLGEPQQFPVHLPTIDQYDGDSLPFDYNIPTMSISGPGKYCVRIHTSSEILRDVSFQVHQR
jgi:hypothetical protein